MAVAHVASAAIRRLQQDTKHKAAMHRPNLYDKRDVPLDLEDAQSACGILPAINAVRSDGDVRGEFEPVKASTPKGKGTQNGSYREEQPFTSSSSSSTTDTESTNSPSTSSISGIVPFSVTSLASPSSDLPTFRAPILGYEIMEQRAKFTVFKIHVQHIPTRASWFVFRRYTDFLRLNRKLRGLFPTKRYSMPPKRWFKDNFEPSFLEDRIQGLQTFVNSILSHKDICERNHVRDFFCFDDPPGPNECLAESRLRCETLADLVSTLRLELSEKEAEIDVVKAELALTKVQRDTLMKSLRLECAIVNNGAQICLGNNPIMERLHRINIVIIENMEHSLASNNCDNPSELASSLPKRQNPIGQEHEKSRIVTRNNSSGMYSSAVQNSIENASTEGFVSCLEDLQNPSGHDTTRTVVNTSVKMQLGENKGIHNYYYDDGDRNKNRISKIDCAQTSTGQQGHAQDATEVAPTSPSSMDDNGNQMFCKPVGIQLHTLMQH